MRKTAHCEHGAFLSVLGIGLLIKAAAGAGKSSLALELIERGHKFISDDVVHFSLEENTGQNRIKGKSPHILKDLLAVRDLGVINISHMFPTNSSLLQHSLDLIIELIEDGQALKSTLSGIQSHTSILGQRVPVQTIHAHPKRNLAIIVETAVKNHILYKQGQDASALLKKRQQQYIDQIL